jgi:hypothetical protein
MLGFDFGPDLDSWSLAENNHAAPSSPYRVGLRQYPDRAPRALKGLGFVT